MNRWGFIAAWLIALAPPACSAEERVPVGEGGTGGLPTGGGSGGEATGGGGNVAAAGASSGGAGAAGGSDAAQDAPDASDGSQDGDTDADAGATCTLGILSFTDSALTSSSTPQPVYFANGESLPAGTYVVTYENGCMKYDKNSASHGWTVNATNPTDPNGAFLWWLVRETTADKVVPLPGNVGYEVGKGAYKLFQDCVDASKKSQPLTIYHTGGKLGIWLQDDNYSDNLPGEGENPSWRLERVGACADAGASDASADADASSPGCSCTCLFNPIDAGGYVYYPCFFSQCNSGMPYCCLCTGVCNVSACSLNQDSGDGKSYCCSKPPGT